MRLCGLFLLQRQVTLMLAVILQPKPSDLYLHRQNVNSFKMRNRCLVSRRCAWVCNPHPIIKRPCRFPSKSIDLASTANGLKCRSLLFAQGHCFCLLIHDAVMPNIARKAVRPSDPQKHVKFKSIQMDSHTLTIIVVFSALLTIVMIASFKKIRPRWPTKSCSRILQYFMGFILNSTLTLYVGL